MKKSRNIFLNSLNIELTISFIILKNAQLYFKSYTPWFLKYGLPFFNIINERVKVNKSVYITSGTYRFCWQYAIIFVWKTWSNVKRNRDQMKNISFKCTLIYFNMTLSSTLYSNDWLKLTFNCFFATQSGNYWFQLANYLTWFSFVTILSTELKKKTWMN